MSATQVLLAITVPVIWGLGFTFAKAGLDQFPPILLMTLRFALTALVLIWFVKPPWRHMGQLTLIAAISATLQYGLTFYGLKGLDASTAVLVIQLEVPFLALIAAVLLRERIGVRRALGMVLAFVGVGLIAGEPRLEGQMAYVLLTAGGAFSWALGQVMISRLGAVGGFTLIAWVAVLATPQMFVASLLIEDGQLEVIASADWVGWGVIIYLGLIMTALGYGIWYRLLGQLQVNQVGPFLLLLPVASVIGSVIILGERLTALTVAGGVVVIAGLTVMTVQRSPFVRRARVGQPGKL
ncbi:MAG: EamA family transporter [Alphaproteobacteria bacterium]|nr:EamA family transporter [Alphaproteobacteria bacterium]